MIDNEKTIELYEALKQYQRTEVDQALKQEIDGAVQEGFRVTLYYPGGAEVLFQRDRHIVTAQTMVGQPSGVLAEKMEASAPTGASIPALDAVDQQQVRNKLSEALRNIMAAKANISGLHLFIGSAPLRPLQENLNVADNEAQRLNDSV